MTLEQAIAQGLTLLELGGFQPGRALRGGQGQAVVATYAAVMSDLTPAEVVEAFEAWVKTPIANRHGELGAFFPTAADLRATVPFIAASDEAWALLGRGRQSNTARLVLRRLPSSGREGAGAGRAFRVAYRELRRRWAAVTPEQRKAVGRMAKDGYEAAMIASGVLDAPLMLGGE